MNLGEALCLLLVLAGATVVGFLYIYLRKAKENALSDLQNMYLIFLVMNVDLI